MFDFVNDKDAVWLTLIIGPESVLLGSPFLTTLAYDFAIFESCARIELIKHF